MAEGLFAMSSTIEYVSAFRAAWKRGTQKKKVADGDLVHAIRTDDVRLLRSALANGADPTAPCRPFVRCVCGSKVPVHGCVGQGGQNAEGCVFGVDPLRVAAWLGSVGCFEELLRNGAEARLVLDDILSPWSDQNGFGALGVLSRRCAHDGVVRMAELALQFGADANAPHWMSGVPLHAAIRRSSVPLVLLLLPATNGTGSAATYKNDPMNATSLALCYLGDHSITADSIEVAKLVFTHPAHGLCFHDEKADVSAFRASIEGRFLHPDIKRKECKLFDMVVKGIRDDRAAVVALLSSAVVPTM